MQEGWAKVGREGGEWGGGRKLHLWREGGRGVSGCVKSRTWGLWMRVKGFGVNGLGFCLEGVWLRVEP